MERLSDLVGIEAVDIVQDEDGARAGRERHEHAADKVILDHLLRVIGVVSRGVIVWLNLAAVVMQGGRE
jgi:hypothetical protein